MAGYPEQGSRLDSVIQRAVAVLGVEYPGRFSPADLHKIVRGHGKEAMELVEKEQRRQIAAGGRPWTSPELSQAMCEALVLVGRGLLGGKHGDLGERLLRVQAQDQSRSPAAEVNEDGASGTVMPQRRGVCNTAVFFFRSGDREGWSGTWPNVCRFSLGKTDGTDYRMGLQGIRRIVLRGIGVNPSPLFTERMEGITFYVGIDEITNDYNRQSSLNSFRAQFECYARPTDIGRIEITIISGTIDLPPNSLDLGTVTVRLYDDVKRPLVLEQDLYPIISYAWDDINQRIIVEVGDHAIRNGDRVALRNMYLSQDRTTFDDSRRFRAEVIDATHVAVHAWRAPLPPGTPPALYPPEGDRVPTTNGAYLMDLNNQVTITLAFDYEMQ